MSETTYPTEAPASLRKAAQISSDLLSPLLIPTYCMILAMCITPLQALPGRTRLLATLAVAFITAAVPFMVIFTLMKLGKVSDNSISNRRERTIPFIAGLLCYLGAAWYMYTLHAPTWLPMFFIAAALSAIIAIAITRVWKISAHATALGGMVGMMAWWAFNGIVPMPEALVWLTVILAAAGWVGTSRLILGRHTPLQVFAGLAMGCTLAVLIVSI